jgi:hypothetical protein
MSSIPPHVPEPSTKRFNGLMSFRGKGYRVRIIALLHEHFFKLVHFADRVGGPIALAGIIFFYFILDLRNRWYDYPRFVRLHDLRPPGFWKGTSAFRHYFRMIWRWHLSCGAILAYPRLGLPYWKKRFKISGTPPQALPEWNTRPVVLASMHVGAFALIPYWLRSLGISAATMVGGLPMILDNAEIWKSRARGNLLYGLQDVPLTFERRGPAVRAAFRFLKPRHILCMAIDGGRLSLEDDVYDAGGFTFYAKQGAARIAAQTNAILIPITVNHIGLLRFDFRFGTPVPDELLQKEDFKAATQHLVTELWKDNRERPDDLTWTPMESYAPELRSRKPGWP